MIYLADESAERWGYWRASSRQADVEPETLRFFHTMFIEMGFSRLIRRATSG